MPASAPGGASGSGAAAGGAADFSSSGARDEPTFADLLGDLARQSRLLLQQELALARKEMLGKVGTAFGGTAFLVAGALLAFAGFLWLLGAAVIGLAEVMPAWAAALVVGGTAILVAGALVLLGRWRLGSAARAPERTLRSLKADAEWAREQMREQMRGQVR